jgi:hypothetical protein
VGIRAAVAGSGFGTRIQVPGLRLAGRRRRCPSRPPSPRSRSPWPPSSSSPAVLDEGFRPLDGRSGEGAAVVGENGLRVPVRWPGAAALSPERRLRLQVRFHGVRPEDARLHALYLGEEPQ